jgi:hypothetical protein
MANYRLVPDIRFNTKEAFALVDESGKAVIEAKMTKFSLFGHRFIFTNYLTNKTEEHKVGITSLSRTNNETVASYMPKKKCSFSFDGKKIWAYLDEIGIDIDAGMLGSRIGMGYDIKMNGLLKATAETAFSGQTTVLMNGAQLAVETQDDCDLDKLFLALFAIARMDETIYH